PYAFSWSFGDGSVGTGNLSMHTYASSGSYNVTVTVTDANGSYNYSSQAITVAAVPTVSFTYGPMSPETFSPVAFNARTTGGVGNVSLTWDFGDTGTTTEKPTAHNYTTSGSFLVSVTATDADGVSITSTQTVNVVASLGASLTFSPSSPHAGDNIIFVASATGGVQPYNYSWSFGDSTTGSGSPVSHIYQ